MKTAAWILALVTLAAIATAGVLRSRELAALRAAEARQQAAEARIAKLGGIRAEVETVQAWRAELDAKVTLIQRLKADAAKGDLEVNGQPAAEAQRLGQAIRKSATWSPEGEAVP